MSQLERRNHTNISEEHLALKVEKTPSHRGWHNPRGGTTATRQEPQVPCHNLRGALHRSLREATGYNERGTPPPPTLDIAPRDETLYCK